MAAWAELTVKLPRGDILVCYRIAGDRLAWYIPTYTGPARYMPPYTLNPRERSTIARACRRDLAARQDAVASQG